jgi:two-component system NarL family sensor kinase
VTPAERHGNGSSGEADRALAIIRLAAVPVILVGDRLVAHPKIGQDPFDLILGLTALYAVIAVSLSFSPYASRVPRALYPALDLLAICALAYVSGGPFSQLRYAFFVMPVGAAFLLRPPQTVLWSLTAVMAYLAVSFLHPATSSARAIAYVSTQSLYLLWMGLAAVVLSVLLTRRAERISDLAATRGRLVAQALRAEEHERWRLADTLHDYALQNVLAARQEVEEAEAGDLAALPQARSLLEATASQLRETTFELHPQVLKQAGLAPAIRAIAEQQARRAGFATHVDVDPAAAGVYDELVFSLTRELLTNAAKHSGAANVTVDVRRADRALLLEVADDGRGTTAESRANAVAEGHIGLASCAERVDSVGGSLQVSSAPGDGTRVSVLIPIEASLDGARAQANGRPAAGAQS